MTGFERQGRSYYLDCMEVLPNDVVICKCNFGMYPFTVGAAYKVQTDKMLFDDNGNLVHPSCRFMRKETT